MKIIRSKKKEYKRLYNKNIDTYGIYCYTLAERWAQLMEEAIDNSDKSPYEVIRDNATNLLYELDGDDIYGISDNLYYCAIFILIEFWVYGKLFARCQREKAIIVYNMLDKDI